MGSLLTNSAYALSAVLILISAVVEGNNVALDDKGHPGHPDQEGVIYTEPEDIGRPNSIATIEVEGWGTIKIELYENMTPITTQNFIDLAESGFYDGIKFHRVIDDFVAQTGDPNTRNNNPYDDGSGGSDETIPLEICRNASHVDGAVGMARSAEPDSASSQFYICDGPQHGLDDWNRDGNGYAVFGIVIEGLDVAKSIAAAETYPSYRPLLDDHPVDDITMTSVTIGTFPPYNETEEDEGQKKEEDSSSLPYLNSLTFLALILLVPLLLKRKRQR